MKKTIYNTKIDRAWFSRLLQHPARKKGRVYSYGPGTRMGQNML